MLLIYIMEATLNRNQNRMFYYAMRRAFPQPTSNEVTKLTEFTKRPIDSSDYTRYRKMIAINKSRKGFTPSS
jgi:hypothetical protein